MKCPNCGRDMDEREIDWTKGTCRICIHEFTDEELEQRQKEPQNQQTKSKTRIKRK